MFKTMPDAVVLFDFELMLNSLVNSYCHIETLTPFYGTFARKSDPNNALMVLRGGFKKFAEKSRHILIL